MTNCKNCGKPLTQLPGKRKKEFCDSTCRSNHFQKEKRRLSLIKKDKPIGKHIELSDLTSPTTEIKPQEQPKSNFAVNTLPKEEIVERLPGESSLEYKLRIAELNK